MLPTIWLWAGALAAAVAGAGIQTVRLAHRDAQIAEERQDRATEKARLLTAAVTAMEAVHDTERRWQAQQQEALNVAQKSTDQARADAAAARDAADRLRQRAAAALRCPAAPGAAATGPSEAASAPGVVCADLLGRLAEAGRLTAEYADRAVIAGQACEASWPR